jgi:hypothetical protein
MLCKIATARKVLRTAWQHPGLELRRASLHRIDARQHFGVAVEACLLVAHVAHQEPAGASEAAVYQSLSARRRSGNIGLAGRELIADVGAYRKLRHLEGRCPGQWRSGLKHDCADVMELRAAGDGSWRNKQGALADLEPEHVFPLIKCSDLAHGRTVPARAVVIPQRRVGDDTAALQTTAPRTWRYLSSHEGRFAARRSSIYRGRPLFAVFGIGDYSFAPWKVAVSGLHRSARFVVVGPHDGKPVLFDDTCYFLPFDTEVAARSTAAILDSKPCRSLLASLMFGDAKRPVTVELLQRLDLRAMAQATGLRLETGWNAPGGGGVRSTKPDTRPEMRADGPGN